MNARDDRFYSRVFALATTGLLGGALFLIVRPFLEPILWSMLLAFLLSPLQRILARRTSGRVALSAIVLTVATAIVLIAPAPLLSVAFASQARDLFGRIQTLVAQAGISDPGDVFNIPIVTRAIDWAARMAPVSADQIQGWLMTGVQTLLQQMVILSGSFVVGALNALVGLGITLFLLFFFLRDGDAIVRTSVRLIPLAPERRDHLIDHVGAVIRAVVFGSLLTALVQGMLVAAGFAMVGLASPLVFGALAAVAALIPLVGTPLVWAPAVGALFLQGRWVAALFLAGWGVVVVSSSDNVLRPLLISGRAEISTLPVFLGVLGGVSAFGPIGLVAGPVLVSLALVLVRLAVEARAAD
ncbi:MAG TPA: AI-2E family transporter [Methylomirabilota bacterium]|jgi:predicted PurR-regulated permease PerM